MRNRYCEMGRNLSKKKEELGGKKTKTGKWKKQDKTVI